VVFFVTLWTALTQGNGKPIESLNLFFIFYKTKTIGLLTQTHYKEQRQWIKHIKFYRIKQVKFLKILR